MAQLQKQLAELVDGISKLHDAFLVMRTKNPYGSITQLAECETR